MKIYEYVITKPKITSPFGYRIHPITHKKTFHNGLDLVSSVGNRNLFAIDDGYVQKVVNNQSKAKTGYGNYIWVRYPRYNLSLLYAHCDSIKLKKGAKVKKGTIVAIEGKTGAATGVHLHLGMTKIGSDTWLNPANYYMLADKYNLLRVLKRGCEGVDVKELQKALGGVEPDGVYGRLTENRVIKFQRASGLKADGIVGKDTAHAMGWTFNEK
jgi:murein DD-endopeptidase MepM/ murein hydrolase activator NlpD